MIDLSPLVKRRESGEPQALTWMRSHSCGSTKTRRHPDFGIYPGSGIPQHPCSVAYREYFVESRLCTAEGGWWMVARHGNTHKQGVLPNETRRGREDDPRNSKELGQLVLAARFEKRHGAQHDQHSPSPMQQDLQPAQQSHMFLVAQQSHMFLIHRSQGKHTAGPEQKAASIITRPENPPGVNLPGLRDGQTRVLCGRFGCHRGGEGAPASSLRGWQSEPDFSTTIHVIEELHIGVDAVQRNPPGRTTHSIAAQHATPTRLKRGRTPGNYVAARGSKPMVAAKGRELASSLAMTCIHGVLRRHGHVAGHRECRS
jgi:hypothetical protein